MEKRHKLAFWGVQVKYSYIRLLLLYTAVLVGMVGWYLVQANVKFKTYGAELTLFEHLRGIPLYLAFLITVLGSQVILSIAYAKQERKRLAMARLLLEPRTVGRIRFGYSLLVTVASFLMYFISVFLLFFVDRLMYPEYAFGIAELYPVFYRFRHLFLIYPVINPWAVLFLILCVAAISQVSVSVASVVRQNAWVRSIYPIGLVLIFLVVSCASDMMSLLVYGTVFVIVVLYVIVMGRKISIEEEPYEVNDGNGGAKG